MKNVLVTGGAGFVGSNLIKHLQETYPKIKITSLDNYFTGKEENHVPGVTYYRGHTWEADSIFERQFKAGKKCTVVSPGNQSRDFTHVEDVVRALGIAAQRTDNHEWHLRSGVNTTMIDLAEMYGDWEMIPERRGERFTSEDFPSDTEEKLGWKPTWKLEDWVNLVKSQIEVNA